MPAVRSLWRVVEKQMTRDRDTGGREVLPGVQGNREAHGAVFDGLWNEVIVRTEAWAKERNRPLLKGLVEARVISVWYLPSGWRSSYPWPSPCSTETAHGRASSCRERR